MTSNSLKIKAKIGKWDCIKLKSFYTAKESINRERRQSTEWEKIFSNHTSDKELNPKYIRNSKQLKWKQKETTPQQQEKPNQNSKNKPKNPNNMIFKMGKWPK